MEKLQQQQQREKNDMLQVSATATLVAEHHVPSPSGVSLSLRSSVSRFHDATLVAEHHVPSRTRTEAGRF